MKYSLFLMVLIMIILSPTFTDCRGGRGGGGRGGGSSSGGSRSSSSRSSYSSSSSSSSRSSYSYTSSTPSKTSYSYSSTPSRSYTSVKVYSYYRPAYYYYSYTYNAMIYVGAYYGYYNGPVNTTAIIVPIAVVGGFFLFIILLIIIAKCTNRSCCGVFCCIFCCSCAPEVKFEEHFEGSQEVVVVEIEDDNHSQHHEIEEIGGLDDKQDVGY